MAERVYFDWNATAPLRAEARAATRAALELTGNASSVHAEGRGARRLIEAARLQVAALVGAEPKDVVFTSGATEANMLALTPTLEIGGRKAPRDRLFVSSVEHPSVRSGGRFAKDVVEELPVDSDGRVDLVELERYLLRAERPLVSIMLANNETGVIQPIAEIARVTRAAGVTLHVDGVQAVGKIPVDVEALGVDLYSMSAHKLYAPKGVGALYVRKGTAIAPVAYGGHHERDRRPGTENVPGIAAFGAAAELAARTLAAESERLAALRDRLENAILERIPRAGVNGSRSRRTPNTANLHFDGIDGEALVIALDLLGFAVSTGAACSSGAIAPSHVLVNMGLSAERARASMRFSLGRSNTAEQVDALVDALVGAVEHLRRIAGHA